MQHFISVSAVNLVNPKLDIDFRDIICGDCGKSELLLYLRHVIGLKLTDRYQNDEFVSEFLKNNL